MSTPTPTPFNPQQTDPTLAQDLQAYMEAQLQLQQDKDLLQKLLLMLHTMKNSMYGAQLVINQMMTINGDKVASLSAVDNIDSDLRGMLSRAQSDYNDIIDGSSGQQNGNPSPAQIASLKDMVATIADLNAFLDWQKSLGPNSIIDGNDIDNMQNAIAGIKGVFQGSWDDINEMGCLMNTWVYNQNTGQTSTEMQAIQNNFQTINQSTSALSATTNTSLQFTTEQYKQFMGIDQSAQDSYLKGNLASIQNQKSN